MAAADGRTIYREIELARRLARADPARRLRHADMLALLDKALTSLTPRMERVLRMRWGLDPYPEPMTLRAIGKEFNVCFERVRSIHDQALGKLRKGERREWIAHAAQAIGLIGKFSPPLDAPVRYYQPPDWSRPPGQEQRELQRVPPPPPQPDQIEIHALTQDMPVERFAEILTPRVTAPIGEMENLARKLGLKRERLHAARLAIPPHWHWHVETASLHKQLRLTLSESGIEMPPRPAGFPWGLRGSHLA